jgi:hypothetical protein
MIMKHDIDDLIALLDQRYGADGLIALLDSHYYPGRGSTGAMTWADAQLLRVIAEQWRRIQELEKRLEELEKGEEENPWRLSGDELDSLVRLNQALSLGGRS